MHVIRFCAHRCADASLDSTVRVSPVMTWLWSPAWFMSTPRYVQRRINSLSEIDSSRRAQIAATTVAA
ncbi:hypothetical protein BFN03_10085 [Rhodococcus sp. WMMA185]|nr:hypothetical protein BFN03_10085 [Rhodococcus sp. WMMA185]